MTATDDHPTQHPTELPRVSSDPRQDQDIREQRREAVAALLLSRKTYRAMIPLLQNALGYDVSLATIKNDVAVIRRRWATRMTADFASHVSEQMAYYDGLLAGVAPKALKGDHTAVQDALGILDRRARLVGMEQPDKLLVGAVVQTTEGVVQRWKNASRDEQIARTDQIMAILTEAKALRLPGGPPLLNGSDPDVIDVNEPGGTE